MRTTHWQDCALVVHEVGSFLAADVAMPLPRSPGTAIAFKPCLRYFLPYVAANVWPYKRVLWLSRSPHAAITFKPCLR